MNKDDSWISEIISGARTSYPEVMPYFMGYAYSSLLTFLYRLNSQIPFYGLSFCFICFTSLFFVCKAFIKNISPEKSCTPLLCFLIIYFSVYDYNFVFLQFSTIGGVACGSVIAIILTQKKEDSKIEKILDNIFLILLSYLSYSIRVDTGYVCFLFYLCTLISEIIIFGKTKIKKVIFLSLYFLISFFLSYTINKKAVTSPEWESYTETNKERSYWSDRGHISYTENEKIFNELGWDEATFKLAEESVFFDKNVTKESFSILKNIHISNISIKEKIIRFFKILNDQFSYLLFSSFLLAYFIFYSKTNKKESFIIICWLLGLLSLYCYLSWNGRMPKRVTNSLRSACYVPLFLYLSNNLKLSIQTKKSKIVLSLVLLFIGFNSMHELHRIYKESEKKEKGESCYEQIYKYAIDNKDKFIIPDRTLTNDVPGPLFRFYEKPTNILVYSGWMYGFPTYLKQLSVNGYKDFYTENFFDSKVIFLERKTDYNSITGSTKTLFPNYMKAHFPNSQKIILFSNDYFIAYKWITENENQ